MLGKTRFFTSTWMEKKQKRGSLGREKKK